MSRTRRVSLVPRPVGCDDTRSRAQQIKTQINVQDKASQSSSTSWTRRVSLVPRPGEVRGRISHAEHGCSRQLPSSQSLCGMNVDII
ncbi:hypothetical protein J6590_094575 [Homalodisca vitripennis]|nr:hypothetical protein J6590_094575 [Homalodisca vitripennis]